MPCGALQFVGGGRGPQTAGPNVNPNISNKQGHPREKDPSFSESPILPLILDILHALKFTILPYFPRCQVLGVMQDF